MSLPATAESVIPLLPCTSLDETLDFYQALGFTVTHQQQAPYLYAAVQRGGIELHFSSLGVYGAKKAFGAYLVFVPAVAPYHRRFADGLRARYGKIPTAGHPRLTRLRPGQTRFMVFDPTGNVVIYIDRHEPAGSYGEADAAVSALARVLANAAFLRDTYANDGAAAKLLDKALAKHSAAPALDRARALAARAELAVAMGDTARAQSAQHELHTLDLSAAERSDFQDELSAADILARWLTQPAAGPGDG